MDLQSGAIALVIVCVAFAFLLLRAGLRMIRSARKMTFYHLRRQREVAGWWRIVGSMVLLALSAAIPVYGLPVAYEYFPPSPTPSLTPTITLVPTITLSPTITLTPTITDTPVVSDTPTATPTPYVPDPIVALFQSSVTPNPDVVFSSPEFTTSGSGYPAQDSATVFTNPVGHMFGIFTYDGMLPGVQWTTLWLRSGQLVHYETKPWDGATGGSGFTDWNPPPQEWEPGLYNVQIFVGREYVVNGRFLVQGDAPTPVSTATPEITASPTVPSSSVPAPTLSPEPTSTANP